MTQPAQLHRAWYLAAALPVIASLGIAALGIAALIGEIRQMPRVVVPGRGTVQLGSGPVILYAEQRSEHRGATYEAPALDVRCALSDVTTGAAIALAEPGDHATYTSGAFAGTSLYIAEIPHAGAFVLDCQGRGGPATVAVGTPSLRRVGFALGGVFVGMIMSAAIVLLVYRARRARGASHAR